jgi:hypothetical protein
VARGLSLALKNSRSGYALEVLPSILAAALRSALANAQEVRTEEVIRVPATWTRTPFLESAAPRYSALR